MDQQVKITSRNTEHRVNHLEKAAKSILVTSPAVSAHILAQRNATLNDQENESLFKGSFQSCSACGNAMIPNWSCKPVKPAYSIRRGAKSNTDDRSRHQRKLQCSMCNTITILDKESSQPAKPKAANYSNQHTTASGAPPSLSSTMRSQPNAIANKTSTTSRRARAKKSSLQSLLADQKKTGSNKKAGGFGLDLTDLMQG